MDIKNEGMWDLCSQALGRFLSNRKDRFPVVSSAQLDEWELRVYNEIMGTLEGNDIFYDNVPDTVADRYRDMLSSLRREHE